jgi:hypothetical protein
MVPADGVTDSSMACITEATPNGAEFGNLQVVVNINNAQIAYSSDLVPPVYYNFAHSYTPTIYDIFPGAAVGNSMINYYGIHRISNLGDGLRAMGDISKMLVGSELCNRFDILNNPISPNSLAYINCSTSYMQEAGKY